ncbi:hypothetical protein BT96DRAFT_913479 [Gymnopus androsaceus JB14]|uniref:F-box domain-containing protein n=1 Tax=Gymnopus androsaceus JB14 TaxID=1447944 RepID=A0A6A4ILJ7_9AGAR|nr:hypothetical protein BT96DRAFT_913479 [Gymnopus androsaceus JB14]
MDRFSALPDEILDLISQEIQEHKSLFSLCLVSKNCYDVFNRRLYESVDSLHDQIPTLTLSENERMPLKGPHPASFVETLTLKFNREDLDSEEMEQ